MSPYVKAIVFLSLGLLVVFGWHFATVLGILGNPPQTRGEFFIRIGLIFFAFLVVSGISAALVSKHTEQPTEPDEREEIVLLKTERVGMVTVYAGLVLVAWMVFTPFTPMQMANALLALVCVTEFVKIVYGVAILKRRF